MKIKWSVIVSIRCLIIMHLFIQIFEDSENIVFIQFIVFLVISSKISLIILSLFAIRTYLYDDDCIRIRSHVVGQDLWKEWLQDSLQHFLQDVLRHNPMCIGFSFCWSCLLISASREASFSFILESSVVAKLVLRFSSSICCRNSSFSLFRACLLSSSSPI